MTGTDLEPVDAITGELVLSGRAGAALQKIREGVAVDPDQKRTPGAARFHKARLSEATRRAYQRWIMQYLYFCSVFGRAELGTSGQGASPETLEHFMVWLASLDPKKGKNAGKLGVGLAPASMRQALAGVHAFHVAARAAWPDTSLALGIIEGHENERAEPGSGISDGEGVPPILMPTLLELIRACPLDTNAGIRDRAMLSSGFAIMARRSEMAIQDIDSISEESGDLKVRISKTKGRRRGREAYLPDWPGYPDCSPVRTVKAWIRRLAELGITVGPLYRGVDQWDNVAGTGKYAGPPVRAGFRMAPETVELVIARAALAAMGEGVVIPKAADLRAHSLRAGGATSSYEAGADILAISRQGGWADNSPVVFRYIRGVDLRLRNPMRLLGGEEGSGGTA